MRMVPGLNLPVSEELRDRAERFRQRADEAERYGSDDLGPSRASEFREYAEKLEGWAREEELWEGRR